LALALQRNGIVAMALARAKLTRQNQISVPAEVRKKLGLESGALVEFTEDGGKVIMRRVGRYTWEGVRKAVFPKGPPKPHTLEALKEGVARYMRKTHRRP
jgi:AbrB family looped-hinge helix DNA binding protein